MQLREEIDDLLARGNAVSAFARVAELWQQEHGCAAAAFIAARYDRLRTARNFTHHNLAILRSFTLEPVVPLLRTAAFVAGIDLSVRLGGFNAYPQEILDERSALYSSPSDTVILAVLSRDIAPELWFGYPDLAPIEVRSSVARVVDSFRSWIHFFRQHSAANLILHMLELPSFPSLGILDAQSGMSQTAAIRQINDGLRAVCAEHRGVFVLDYEALIARYGHSNWQEDNKWLSVRMPIDAAHMVHLAHEWLRFLIPLTGRGSKVLVVDLDNTLWRGVIGEDGMEGIQLGEGYPGAAYQALQRALLDLHRKGILLAVCSKNNFDEAVEVLGRHPGMLLKPDHFAALRINWNDKASNLREIASELNIGTDAMAFLDDNPVERAHVRGAIPEVTILDLPVDPSRFADIVRDCPFFERLGISEEDDRRTAMYAADRERNREAQAFASKEDFYRSLEQEAEIATVRPATLTRIAQLTQKTNQFNLTTRRYTEQQITQIADSPGWQVISLRLRDRYGDHGLVGVAITHTIGDSLEIDTFLLSCRVIGRDIETALLSHLVETARGQGVKIVRGRFLPTKKNAPAEQFYARHGFTVLCTDGEGTLWVLDLEKARIDCPDWVKVCEVVPQ